MKAGTKILIGTLSAIAVVSIFAFRKKITPVLKKVGKLVIPDSSPDTDTGAELAKGSTDMQHVLQLQGVLNDIHDAVRYINENCSAKWARYSDVIPMTGIFDDRTEGASQFYLNRKTVDLDYLNDIRAKVAKYKAGDKCKYPLSY